MVTLSTLRGRHHLLSSERAAQPTGGDAASLAESGSNAGSAREQRLKSLVDERAREAAAAEEQAAHTAVEEAARAARAAAAREKHEARKKVPI